ncbi:putative transporter SVOPL [Intoshia linei]|uniref:Putative transporter SVOPL n=1 Tax=Intoshia linei TaxID=1819745 RepID=A0A177BET0_9BILA|nr:putative transporter SVOPL [Intoshia linei]
MDSYSKLVDNNEPRVEILDNSSLMDTMDDAKETDNLFNQIPSKIEYTVEDAVEHIGFGKFQLWLIFVCGLFSATDALEMLLLSVLSPALRCDFKLTEVQVAFITTIVFVGMFSGSFLWGTISDKYGRLITMFVSSIWILYFGIGTAFSPNYYWMLILRGIVGFAFGGAIQSFTLISEYLPSKYRAKVLIIYSLMWAVGSLFEIGMASIIIPRWGWRVLVAVSALPMLLTSVCVWTLPESARFLVASGRHNQAYNVLNYIAYKNGKTLPSKNLISLVQIKKPNVMDLFRGDYLRTSLQVWFIWFLVAFSYYGMILGQSEILEFKHITRVHTETSPVHEISQCHCNSLSSSDYNSMVIATLGEFVAIPFNLFTIDWLGRKYTLMINFLIAGLAFLLILVSSNKMVLTFFVFLVRAFTSGLFNCIYIYTIEVYPTIVRSSGLGIGSSMARIGAMLTPFVSQVLLNYSLTAAISLYGVLCILCAVNAFYLKHETSGKKMKQTT